jgi:hypothetical protein
MVSIGSKMGLQKSGQTWKIKIKQQNSSSANAQGIENMLSRLLSFLV